MLTFWSVSVTNIHKELRFHSTVVHFYCFWYLQIWHALSVLTFGQFLLQTVSFPLNCRSFLPVQIPTNQTYPSSTSLGSLSVTHIHKEHRFHTTVPGVDGYIHFSGPIFVCKIQSTRIWQFSQYLGTKLDMLFEIAKLVEMVISSYFTPKLFCFMQGHYSVAAFVHINLQKKIFLINLAFNIVIMVV